MREDDALVGELREASARQDWLAACEALARLTHPDLRDALLAALPEDLGVAARLLIADEQDGARWTRALERAEWPGRSVEVFWELLELNRIGGATLRWRGPWEDLVGVQLDGIRWEELRHARWRLGREWHRVLAEPVGGPLCGPEPLQVVFLRTYLEQVREFVDAEDGEWEELDLPDHGPLDEDEHEHLIPTPDGETLWVHLVRG